MPQQPKQTLNYILFILLSVVVFVGWFWLERQLWPPPPPGPEAKTKTAHQAQAEAVAVVVAAADPLTAALALAGQPRLQPPPPAPLTATEREAFGRAVLAHADARGGWPLLLAEARRLAP